MAKVRERLGRRRHGRGDAVACPCFERFRRFALERGHVRLDLRPRNEPAVPHHSASGNRRISCCTIMLAHM